MTRINGIGIIFGFTLGLASAIVQALAAAPAPEETGQMAFETVRCTANPDQRQKTLPQDGAGETAAGGGVVEGS